MKKTILLPTLLLMASVACHKPSARTYRNTATITGFDYSTTICGGKYWIVVHGITDSIASFDSLPAGSGVDLSTATFPVNILLNWHLATPTMCNKIVVDDARPM